MSSSSLAVGVGFMVLLACGVGCVPSPDQSESRPVTPTGDAVTPPREPVADPAPTAPDADLKMLVDGNNAFAIDLYKRLAEKDGNVVVSPYSIRTALALTFAGARGPTADQMQKVLYFAGLPDQKLHTAFDAVARKIQSDASGDYRLLVANALWGQKDYQFRSEFLELARTHYAGTFREVDFASNPSAARQTINRWVADQTSDRIKEILGASDLSPDTRLVITNTVYLKAAWATPFLKGETKETSFNTSPGEKIMTAMMQTDVAPFKYLADSDCQWLELPYRSGRLSLLIVLPRLGRLATVERSLSAAELGEGTKRLVYHRGVVSLPRFQVTSVARLKDELSCLGMPLAFTHEADFSGMVGHPALRIKDINHQAYLSVDETGSEAAAATAVEMMVSNFPPFSFVADRPFLFFLRDNPTGNILFCGRIVRPNK